MNDGESNSTDRHPTPLMATIFSGDQLARELRRFSL